MKFCLVAPGHTTIPPVGWGAVESIIWDYNCVLTKLGHNVDIVNIPQKQNIIKHINSHEYDVIHVMYDDHVDIFDHIKSNAIQLYTTHWAFLTNKNIRESSAYFKFINHLMHLKNKPYIFALSQSIKDMYASYGYPESKIIVHSNGVNLSLFHRTNKPFKSCSTLYLGKIDERKGQANYQELDNLVFVGDVSTNKFNSNHKGYLGPWTKEQVHLNMTEYGNLLLLSSGEADPLVVKEAFAAGLGVVVSECSTANIDTNLPFIDVIPNKRLNDMNHVTDVIEKNRSYSVQHRDDILEYALNFSLTTKVISYVNQIKALKSTPVSVPVSTPTMTTTDVTLVTALFDIGRASKGDGRAMDDYCKWFIETLKINCPMYIVTEEKYEQLVKTHRKYPYTLKIVKFDKLDYYQYHDQIGKILNSHSYQERVKNKDRVECKMAEYNIIQYSKMEFLDMCIQENPYQSTHFFWIDAGISRFFYGANPDNSFPNHHAIEYIKSSGDKFIIQCRHDIHQYPIRDDFMLEHVNLVTGTMFGGTPVAISTISNLLRDMFVDQLSKGITGNEQLGLAYVWNTNKSKFRLFPSIIGLHLSMFIIFSQHNAIDVSDKLYLKMG